MHQAKSITILRIGSLLLPLLGSVLWGTITYLDERQRAIDQAHENVALVRQYTQRLVQTQTVLHDAALAHVDAQPDPDYLTSRAFHDFLARIEGGQGMTLGLALIGLDGTWMASSRAFPVSSTASRRDYLDGVRAGSTLILDRITLQPQGQDALIVVKPFRHGSFQGAIVSAVSIEAIRGFLRSVARRDGESASLLRDDGKLLVRHVPTRPMFLDPWSPARLAMAQGNTGHYSATAVTDGTTRLYAFSKTDDLPIYAQFGIARDLILWSWFWRSVPVWILLSAGGLFSFVLGGFVRRSLKERSAHEEQARLRQEAERKAEQHQRFMRELNHRVKNNLALVDSMIGIQMRREGGLDGNELKARVAAIADVHDVLYQAANAHQMDLGELLQQVCRSPALVPAERDISLDLRAQDGVMVGADTATSLALVVVELVTNAVKYAFPDDRRGTISICLSAGSGEAELRVGDDGIGISDGVTRSSGMKIVEAFVQQIEGRMTRSTAAGTCYRITFPSVGPSGAPSEAPSEAAA